MSEEIGSHYNEISETYEKNPFYDRNGYLIGWATSKICSHLELCESDNFLDLGAGDGVACLKILSILKLMNVTCVEPSTKMCEIMLSNGVKNVVEADAIGFLTNCCSKYDKLLMKEVIHHIAVFEYDKLFSALKNAMHISSKLLIITRPRSSRHYPFFEKANEVWESEGLDVDLLQASLVRNGFKVRIHEEKCAMSIAKVEWIRMIRSRFWSTFRREKMTEEDIENGIKEIEARYEGTESVEFNEIQLFVVVEFQR